MEGVESVEGEEETVAQDGEQLPLEHPTEQPSAEQPPAEQPIEHMTEHPAQRITTRSERAPGRRPHNQSHRILRFRHAQQRRELLRRTRVRRIVVALASTLLLLLALLTPLALTVASGLQDYSDLRDLGLSGIHHLLAAKADLLPSTGTSASLGGSCSGSSLASLLPSSSPSASPSPSPSASPRSTPPSSTPSATPAPASATADLSSALSHFTMPSASSVAAAHNEFTAAQHDFQSVNDRLKAPDVTLSIAGNFSTVAAKLAAAGALARAGSDIAALGAEWTAAALPIVARLHGAALANNAELVTSADLNAIQRALDDSLRILGDVQAQVAAVNIHQLPLCAGQQAEFSQLVSELPRARDLVRLAQTWIGPVSWLLGVGTPRRFLIQTLDRSELRPTGGFAGEYGVLTIQNGRVAAITLNNVDLLDYGHYSNGWAIGNRPPAVYSWWPIANWGLRDANLSPDFPTDARLVMSVFKSEGGGDVDGVININSLAIAHVLRITGPLTVPLYGDVVTADNLEQKIHYYQLDPAGEARNHALFPNDTQAFARKRFVQLVARLLEDHVRHMPLNQLKQVAKQALADIQARDIQVYVTNPTIEQVLAQHRATGTIVTPPGVDSFFVVHTNWSAAKSTPHIQVVQNDDVWLDNQGGATHYLTVTMTNVADDLPYYGPTTYQDFVRVYAPGGAQLLGADGFDTGTKLCDIKKCPAVPYPNGELVCPPGHYDPLDRTGTILGNDKNRPLDVLGGPTTTQSDVPRTTMWGGNVVIPIFCTATLWLSWYVPNVAAPSHAVHAPYQPYTLIVQREGGTFYEADITIHPASGVAADGRQTGSYSAILATSMAFTLGKQPQPYAA